MGEVTLLQLFWFKKKLVDGKAVVVAPPRGAGVRNEAAWVYYNWREM